VIARNSNRWCAEARNKLAGSVELRVSCSLRDIAGDNHDLGLDLVGQAQQRLDDRDLLGTEVRIRDLQQHR
jgi:hypothetical protein